MKRFETSLLVHADVFFTKTPPTPQLRVQTSLVAGGAGSPGRVDAWLFLQRSDLELTRMPRFCYS